MKVVASGGESASAFESALMVGLCVDVDARRPLDCISAAPMDLVARAWNGCYTSSCHCWMNRWNFASSAGTVSV